MRKAFKMFAGVLAVVLTIVLCGILFLYLRVDNRVSIDSEPHYFQNSSIIQRLDSTTLTTDSVSAYITALMQKANVQGLGISIINDSELKYQRYFGKRNIRRNEEFLPGCIWYGASLSKTVFADVVLQLCEEKIIDLDTPLYRYLEKPLYAYHTNNLQRFFGANFFDYSDLEGDRRYKKITARMCLSHTTGLPNWRWLEPDRKLKINFEPGTGYSYSGEGMFLLQMVVEEVTGRSFEELADERVFNPLQMNRTSFVWQRAYEGNYAVGHDQYGNDLRIPKQHISNAAGSMSTSLEDYTKFFGAVLGQGEKRYKSLLTPQIRITSRQQFGPNASVETNENDSIELSYGLGFGLYKTPYGDAYFKEGHLEGWQHYAVGFPSTGTAVIILSNSDQAESIFKQLIEFSIGNEYTPWFWEGYIPLEN